MHCFAPRQTFGRYVESEWHATLGAHPDIPVAHHPHAVVGIDEAAAGFALALSNGTIRRADRVVLALGPFRPTARIERAPALAYDARYVTQPWQDRFPGLSEARHVTIIGTGLTMVDVIATMEAQGYDGHYTIVSRHGLLPQRHADTEIVAPLWADAAPVPTTRGVLRDIRVAMRAAQAREQSWQTVVPAVRARATEVWQSLPLQEQRRFLRHLPRFMDVFLHRAPPTGAQHLSRLREDGRLSICAARIVRVDEDGNGIRLSARRRGQDAIESWRSDLVVNASGFAFDWTRAREPLAVALLARQWVVPHPLKLGIRTRAGLAVETPCTRAAGKLYAIGAPVRGDLLEALSVRSLLAQSDTLAASLLASLTHPV